MMMTGGWFANILKKDLERLLRLLDVPYSANHFSLMRLPLLTIVTLGSINSRLQNLTISPTYVPLCGRNGSPPLKLIFSIPTPQQCLMMMTMMKMMITRVSSSSFWKWVVLPQALKKWAALPLMPTKNG